MKKIIRLILESSILYFTILSYLFTFILYLNNKNDYHIAIMTCISFLLTFLYKFLVIRANIIYNRELTDSEFRKTGQDNFSAISEDDNAALAEIVKYVQSKGGGETFVEMDNNQQMRLKTVVKKQGIDVAVDLGLLSLPSSKHKANSPEWKVELEKVIDDLSVKVDQLLDEPIVEEEKKVD